MSHTNDNIKAPVSIFADIARVFGVGSGDLATIIQIGGPTIVNGVVTKEGIVNKFAKYHPQLIDIVPQPVRNITDNERSTANYPWGLFVDARFRDIDTFMSSYGHNYEYRGYPVNGPYRTSDFVKTESNGELSTTVGYNHHAKCFVDSNDIETNSLSKKEYYYIEHTPSGIKVSVDWYWSAGNDEISLADLNLGVSPATDGYFAVILMKNATQSSPATYRLICAMSKINSDSSSTVTIPDSLFTVNGENYTIYPIVSFGNDGYTGEGGIVSPDARLNFEILALPAKTFGFQVVNASSLLTGGQVTINSFTLEDAIQQDRTSLSFSASLPNTPAARDLGSVSVQFKVSLFAVAASGQREDDTPIFIPGTPEGDYYVTMNVGTGSTSHIVSWVLSQHYDKIRVVISHVGTSTYEYATATAEKTINT